MKNVVYIFGAGASKDFGLPLGAEIFKSAYELSESQAPSVKKLGLDKLIPAVENNLRLIFSGLSINKDAFPPFEEILTFIWDLKQKERFNYKQNKVDSIFETDGREIFDTFTNFYASVLIGNLYLNKKNDNLKFLNSFIKSLDYKDNNISFISFNYDTILDDILSECVNEKIIKEYTYGIPLFNFNDNFDPTHFHSRTLLPINGVNLLKPHGSLNLLYCSHKQAKFDFGYFYNNNYLQNQNSDLRCPCCSSQVKQLMIPPLYNKESFIKSTVMNKPFNFRSTPENYRIYVDQRITECLINVDEIIAIGYSMPSYDFDFKSLLIKSLMQNKKRNKVSLKIITKNDSCYIPPQFQNLVGKVSILDCDGFLSFLKSRK